MLQSDDMFMVSEDRTRAYVHCLCGETEDNITFVYDTDAFANGSSGWRAHVSIQPASGWRNKLLSIWQIIVGGDPSDTFILNHKSALSMRNWLSEHLEVQPPTQ